MVVLRPRIEEPNVLAIAIQGIGITISSSRVAHSGGNGLLRRIPSLLLRSSAATNPYLRSHSVGLGLDLYRLAYSCSPPPQKIFDGSYLPCVRTPVLMPQLEALGRFLGPKMVLAYFIDPTLAKCCLVS
jgi:hypothetical protein